MTLRAMWDALSAWPAGLRLWGAAVSDALDAPSSPVPGTKRSVTVDGGDLQLVGDADAPGASKRYGTDHEGVRGWQDADDAPPGAKGSLEVDDGDLQLDGDSTSPAAGLAYSTDHEGNRGWHQPPNGWVLVQEEVADPIPDRPAVAGPGQVIWSLLSAPTGQPDALDIVINRSGDPWE